MQNNRPNENIYFADSGLCPGDSYTLEANQNGLETFILMHSRMGIRMEYNLDKQHLNLWISPGAGKSLDYRDRNFSNRDDHTSIFDRISFPGLSREAFLRCDYDPFHSTIYYQNQTMHLLSLFDTPAIVIWFTEPAKIDFKTDKADILLERSNILFTVSHPDRGRIFSFAASMGEGNGKFIHQRVTDRGRSIHARAELSPGQILVIAGELKKEKVPQKARKIASTAIDRLLAANEKKIANALSAGKFIFNEPEIQHLFNINQRIILSNQDASGAIHASIKYVYYLIWQMDGSVTTTLNAHTGWVEPLGRWNEFQLSNPTVCEEPGGRFFGQLVNGKISKREEYGIFYATWAAFTHWTQTGDKRYASGKYLKALEDGMDWVERYIFDTDQEAFGSYYHGEDPFFGSHDFGWDEAIGRPMSTEAPYCGEERILRAYTAGFNLQMYNCYLMLAAMETGWKAEIYLKKANALAKVLRRYLGLEDNCVEISNGFYLLESGKMVPVSPGKRGGYECSLPYFFPDYPSAWEMKEANFKEKLALVRSGYSEFAFLYFWELAGLDTVFHSESLVIDLLQITLAQCKRPGRYLPMAWTMVEKFNIQDGEYHDNRPQCFTVGAFQGAMANLALKRLPFGIAVRGSHLVKQIENYIYKHAMIDLQYRGKEEFEKVELNGKELLYTLQLPESLLQKGKNVIQVTLGRYSDQGPLLVYSTIRLVSVGTDEKRVIYEIEAFGKNTLIFARQLQNPEIKNKSNQPIPSSSVEKDDFTHLVFDGRGMFRILVDL